MRNLTKKEQLSISNYRKMGIDISILPDERVRIEQKTLINGYILNQKQLYDRAREIFPDRKIVSVVFSFNTDLVTIEWIEKKMKEFGIRRNDLIKQLAIDHSSLSLFLSGKRGMGKSQRAAFYFYFLTYELNRDFREVLNG